MSETRATVLGQLIHAMAHQKIFFLVWFGIVALFVHLMMKNYRKHMRRNFRGPGDRTPLPSSLRPLTPTRKGNDPKAER